MTQKIELPYTHYLVEAGLSKEQAVVYQVLLKTGPRPAGRLPRLVNLSRPYVYKVLDELSEQGLVVKNQPLSGPAKFSVTHPFAIQELLKQQSDRLNLARESVSGIMSSLLTEYTQSSQLPGVRILSGTEGISDLYNDILRDGKDFCMIRSTFDDDSPELMDLVLNQIRKQIEKNIHVRLIGPRPTNISQSDLSERDKKRLTERKTFPREDFSLPSQIIIYGNKVGITAYDQTPTTTIVENDSIAKTIQTIFELLWNQADSVY